eukprot:2899-Eustigmatos_ZCMA.PRE.1
MTPACSYTVRHLSKSARNTTTTMGCAHGCSHGREVVISCFARQGHAHIWVSSQSTPCSPDVHLRAWVYVYVRRWQAMLKEDSNA